MANSELVLGSMGVNGVDITSELTLGSNIDTGHTDIYGFMFGNLIIIEGSWKATTTLGVNDSIVEYPLKYAPSKQIRGAGCAWESDSSKALNANYWATSTSHRIGQSASPNVVNGNFIIAWVIE